PNVFPILAFPPCPSLRSGQWIQFQNSYSSSQSFRHAPHESRLCRPQQQESSFSRTLSVDDAAQTCENVRHRLRFVKNQRRPRAALNLKRWIGAEKLPQRWFF